MKRRWLRILLFFGLVPLLGGLLACPLIRQGLIWCVAGTPGLVVHETTYQGQPLRYAVIEPEERFRGSRPLVIVLHGAFSCGSEGVLPAYPLTTSFVQFMREEAGAIVLLPQFPVAQGSWVPEWNPRVWHLLAEAQERYAVDTKRIYLMGLSMGGQGSWCLAAERPSLFAAVLPMCGQGNPQWATALKELPLWAFHGESDTIIPPQGSREMVAAIRTAGGERIRYSEYPGLRHDCWTRTFNDRSVLQWMIEQKSK